MKAVRYHEKGKPGVLQVDDIDIPEPDTGELLIRVEFAGVNYGDVLQRGGGYYPIQPPLPAIPGNEVLGVVEAVGDAADPTLIGRRVLGMARTGGYAEYTVGPATNFELAPDDVDPRAALAGMWLGVTATLILTARGQLEKGESVWVPAAAGGLGYLAVQLARAYGAGAVFGGASSENKRQLVLDAGADDAFDYTHRGWSEHVKHVNGGSGVDLALETVGGDVLYETLEVVRDGGRIVNYGNASDTDSPINPRVLLRKNLTFSGFMGGYPYPQRQTARDEVVRLMRSGELRPLIGGVFGLADAAQAHHALEDRTSAGKLIISPLA